MLKKIVLGVAVLGLVIGLAPSASAACAVLKVMSTYNSSTGQYVYWPTTVGNTGTLTGQSWQLGAYASWNDRQQGTSPACSGNLYFAAGGTANSIGLQLLMNACGAGCPTPGATVAYLAQNKSNVPGGPTDFLLITSAETNNGLNWDLSLSGPHNLVPIPRPRVTSSSRAGNLVNLQVAMDPTSVGATGPGAANAITGYKVLARQAATDPGRSAAAYTQTLNTYTTSGGGSAAALPASVDCTNQAQDYWLVTQIIVEGGAVGSDAVSQATRVGCNPALADPKFKIIDKKPVGTKPGMTPKH
jgi:hypothetical protein